MIKTSITIIVSVIVGYLISHFNILNFVISSLIEVTVINNKKVILGAIFGQALLYFFIFYLPLKSVANQLVLEESSINYKVNQSPKTPTLSSNNNNNSNINATTFSNQQPHINSNFQQHHLIPNPTQQQQQQQQQQSFIKSQYTVNKM